MPGPDKKRPNPKSFRPDADETALIRELLDFYGVKSETELLRMAYRALNRERHAIAEMYPRSARREAQASESNTGNKPAENAGAHKTLRGESKSQPVVKR